MTWFLSQLMKNDQSREISSPETAYPLKSGVCRLKLKIFDIIMDYTTIEEV